MSTSGSPRFRPLWSGRDYRGAARPEASPGPHDIGAPNGKGLYADSALQVLYVALGFYGWWHWLHGGPTRGDLAVTSASPRLRVAIALAALLATVALGTFLEAATDSTVPYPDAATTVLSVTAQLLLTRKLIETWPVWILGVNVPFVAIYLYKGLALTAALQLVFIALSIVGWVAWRRSMTDRSGLGAVGSSPAIANAAAEARP